MAAGRPGPGRGGRPHWSDTIVWAKDRFVLGRADYQRQYEPIWYGWPQGRQRHWDGGRDQGDVWTIPRPSVSPLHPTQKPLALVERAITNSSRPGDWILDPFCGSGTTLIACERTGRRGIGIEIDPRYVAATIARWETVHGGDRRPPGSRGDSRWLTHTGVTHVNKQGRPCGAPPLVEGDRCFWHDPAMQEAAAEARRLGGQRRKREGAIQGAFDLEGVKTGADLRRVLEVALLDTLEQENSVARTRALVHVISVLARLQETTEFEARLQALEVGVRGARPDARPQPLPPRTYLRHPDGRLEELQRDAPREDPDAAA